MIKILTFTTLFPNNEQPNNAVFIQHRMAAVHKYCNADVRIVAPVPWYPDIPLGNERWKLFARVPYNEIRAGMPVYHPRYLVTPKIGMTFYSLFMFLGVIATVRRIYRKWPFDIIDAHYVYPDGMAAILLGKLFKCPVVVSARGTDINLYPRFRMIRPLIKQVLIRADGLIAVCRSLADIMVELGAQPNKIRVIPNGIDPNLFHPIKKNIARQKVGVPVQTPILLTVGSLRKLKGMHLLIQALHVLKNKQLLNWKTCLIGNGEEKHHLEHQIKTFGLEEQVILLGEIPNEELRYWYSAADLFFLGSSREGWPNVINEALACGTPVVATNVSGIPDILSSHDVGIIVERNVSAFAEALQQGMKKKWDRREIRQQGQARTWSQVAQEVCSLFCSIKQHQVERMR